MLPLQAHAPLDVLQVAECPEQLNGLPQGRSTSSDQIGLEHHVAEHRQEKEQKVKVRADA